MAQIDDSSPPESRFFRCGGPSFCRDEPQASRSGRDRSIALARSSKDAGIMVVLAVQRDPAVEDPGRSDLHDIAVAAVVKDRTDRGRRGVVLLVEATDRVHLKSLLQTSPFWLARVETAVEQRDSDVASELASTLREHVLELTASESGIKAALERADSPSRVADTVGGWLDVPAERKVALLTELDVERRLEITADLVREARARADLRDRVESRVRGELSKSQREMLLREQLRAIRRELGDDGDGNDPLDPLRSALAAKPLPDEVKEVAERELRRLEEMPSGHAEAQVIRTYLETLVDLPWFDRAETTQDIDAIAVALDADHYGLDEVKQRVLEHMAVLKLSNARQGTILCLVGPPGVGKTSLAQSVADATGRPLARVSLGGVRDEAEIRGHRRTYIGSLPGRVISALRKVKARNPVMVLDEVDKLGRGWAGDPEAALLELLDPEQNDKFTDHYLELPFDLSEVLFIATANDLSTMSPPLRDRLEIIEISGYTLDEKTQIARDHLLPTALSDHGLTGVEGLLTDDQLRRVAREYTREAGVRQLKRQLNRVCRSQALKFARRDGTSGERSALTDPELREILGRPKFLEERTERFEVPGIAAGLAWTPVGGDILFIETTKMRGKGQLEITGQLGEVMTESARAALAYLRSHAEQLGIGAQDLEHADLHLHVPAGAVPKDGPSAGVTIFTALGSLLTGRRARNDTAMTGEVTLRGRVLPVGGIKSKVLAAHRAGFKRLVLPKRNEADLEDVPGTVRRDLDIFLVSDMREVFELTLEETGEGGRPESGPEGNQPPAPTSAAA